MNRVPPTRGHNHQDTLEGTGPDERGTGGAQGPAHNVCRVPPTILDDSRKDSNHYKNAAQEVPKLPPSHHKVPYN